MRELVLPLIWCECGGDGPLFSSVPASVRRTGPRIMRVSGLAMSIAGCSILECRPCTSPGQHSGPGPDCEGIGEPNQKVGEQRTSQHLVGCSTWDKGPHSLAGQHNRAGSAGVGIGEQAPEAQEQENCLLLVVSLDDLTRVVLENYPWG